MKLMWALRICGIMLTRNKYITGTQTTSSATFESVLCTNLPLVPHREHLTLRS